MPEITNTQDIIDSRDIIARLEELGDVLRNSYEQEEYIQLKRLAKAGQEASEDWQYGATLICDLYFREYTKQLVLDIGDLPRDIPSYIVIDWGATADNIRQDYTEVDFDGETYLVR